MVEAFHHSTAVPPKKTYGSEHFDGKGLLRPGRTVFENQEVRACLGPMPHGKTILIIWNGGVNPIYQAIGLFGNLGDKKVFFEGPTTNKEVPSSDVIKAVSIVADYCFDEWSCPLDLAPRSVLQ